MTFFERMYKMFQPAVFKLWRIQVSGEENIPEGGAIVASNHTAFSDVLVISASTKRQVRYMAKKELFKIPLLAQLIRGLGAYPVNRGGADVSSIKLTISMLEAGELIGIFPQGHRHGKKDPRTTEVKAGVGMIAYRSKAPIVPVFIDNARGKTGILRKNYVTFGKPIYFDELEFVSGGQTEYLNASKIIFRKVCEIKFGEGNGSLE